MMRYLSMRWAVCLHAIWQQDCRSFNLSLRIARAGAVGAVTLGLMLSLTPDNPALGQVLNNRLVELLGNNCSGLGVSGTSPGFGANLNNICAFPATASTGIGGGGGAASVQASAASILNRNILQRLEETRAEEGQEGAKASSMMMARAVFAVPSRSTNVCSGSVRWSRPAAVMRAFEIFIESSEGRTVNRQRTSPGHIILGLLSCA